MAALSAKMNRPFEWSHNQIIVLGKALAGQGLEQLIDLLSQQYPMRPRVYLLLSESQGADILKARSVWKILLQPVWRKCYRDKANRPAGKTTFLWRPILSMLILVPA